MNKIFAIATTLAMYGNSVLASDFDNNTITLEALYNKYDMSVDVGDSDITDITFGVTGFDHNLGDVRHSCELYNFRR